MDIEKQVCTIEQGTKLRSLCISKSLHSWYARKLHIEDEYKNVVGSWHPSWNHEIAYSYYSEIQLSPALTVAELGELMPENYLSKKFKQGWNIVRIEDDNTISDPLVDWGETEAEARANFIIFIL